MARDKKSSEIATLYQPTHEPDQEQGLEITRDKLALPTRATPAIRYTRTLLPRKLAKRMEKQMLLVSHMSVKDALIHSTDLVAALLRELKAKL